MSLMCCHGVVFKNVDTLNLHVCMDMHKINTEKVLYHSHDKVIFHPSINKILNSMTNLCHAMLHAVLGHITAEYRWRSNASFIRPSDI
jgi:hypothetical protein